MIISAMALFSPCNGCEHPVTIFPDVKSIRLAFLEWPAQVSIHPGLGSEQRAAQPMILRS